MTNNYSLAIEYNGCQYRGWQKQPDVPSIQKQIEQALSHIANHEISTVCAGRTDAKVHATHQIIHFTSNAHRPLKSWVHGCNSFLPHDIRIKWAKQVPDSFNARFSAQERTYHYIMHTAEVAPALLTHQISRIPYALDVKQMQHASENLIGEHDFTSFRGRDCQSISPNRNVKSIEIIQKNEFVALKITANAFLQHMVRNIAGVLITIGTGKKPKTWAEQVLEAKTRGINNNTAPPEGLYLTGVKYPEELEIPNENLQHPLLQIFY